MNFDTEKISLLESALGKGHKANRDYIQFTCPFHIGKNGPKLGISLGTGKWKCWVCKTNGRSVSGLFQRLNLNQGLISRSKVLFQEKVEFQKEVSDLNLPSEFIPLWSNPTGSIWFNKAKNYLKGRGVQESDIIKHRIGYCETGQFSDMIIFPSYNEFGQLNFFSSRTFNEDAQWKFSIPKNIDKNEIIIDENLVNWSEPIILVESKLDAIIIKRNSIPLGGKQLSKKLKIKILESNCPEIILCLDGDALKDVMDHAQYFINQGILVKRVILPFNEDANSLGHDRIWELINRAEIVNESNSFEFRMKERLNKR